MVLKCCYHTNRHLDNEHKRANPSQKFVIIHSHLIICPCCSNASWWLYKGPLISRLHFSLLKHMTDDIKASYGIYQHLGSWIIQSLLCSSSSVVSESSWKLLKRPEAKWKTLCITKAICHLTIMGVWKWLPAFLLVINVQEFVVTLVQRLSLRHSRCKPQICSKRTEQPIL